MTLTTLRERYLGVQISYVTEDNWMVSLINCYGPCTYRKNFWDLVVNSGVLAQKTLSLQET
jgi:hypothetical protein